MNDLTARTDVAAEQHRLTDKEARLIEAITEASSQGKTLTREEAGTAAGYGSGDTARISATRALKRPHVRAALMVSLREAAQVDAAGSLAVLRHLERNARSERVQLDAAFGGMRIGGLDTQQQAYTGPGVVMQLVFKHGGGSLLTQPPAQPAKPQADQRHVRVTHSLAEGEGGPQGADQGTDPTPRASTRGRAKAPPGVEKSRAKSAAGVAARRPPKNSPARKNPGSGKPRASKPPRPPA